MIRPHQRLSIYYKVFLHLGKFHLARYAVFTGQWGVPVVVVVFAGLYWILGIAKYYSG